MPGSDGIPPSSIIRQRFPNYDGQHFFLPRPPSYFPEQQHYQQQLYMVFSQHPNVVTLPPKRQNAMFKNFCAFISDQRMAAIFGHLDLNAQIQQHIQFTVFIQQKPHLNHPNIDAIGIYLQDLQHSQLFHQRELPRRPHNHNDSNHGQQISPINFSRVIDASRHINPQETNLNNCRAIESNHSQIDLFKITTANLGKPWCTIADAHKMLYNIVKNGIKPDTQVCDNVLYVCAKSLQHATTPQEVQSVFNYTHNIRQMMIDKHIPFNQHTCSTLINVCARALQHATTPQEVQYLTIDKINDLFKNIMSDMTICQIIPDQIFCNLMLTFSRQSNNVRLEIQVLSFMLYKDFFEFTAVDEMNQSSLFTGYTSSERQDYMNDPYSGKRVYFKRDDRNSSLADGEISVPEVLAPPMILDEHGNPTKSWADCVS